MTDMPLKTVRFNLPVESWKMTATISGYRCSEPGNNTGDYVPAHVAQKLYDALEALQDDRRDCHYCNNSGIEPETIKDACRNCGGYGFNVGGDIRQHLIDADAALAAAESE